MKAAWEQYGDKFTRVTGTSEEHSRELDGIIKRKLSKTRPRLTEDEMQMKAVYWLSVLENLVADKIDMLDGEYGARPDERTRRNEVFCPSKTVCVAHGKGTRSCWECVQNDKPFKPVLDKGNRHIQLLLRDFGEDGERVAEIVWQGYADIKAKGERPRRIFCHPMEMNTGDLRELRRELTTSEAVGVTLWVLREHISNLHQVTLQQEEQLRRLKRKGQDACPNEPHHKRRR